MSGRTPPAEVNTGDHEFVTKQFRHPDAYGTSAPVEDVRRRLPNREVAMTHHNLMAIRNTSRRHGPCQQCGWTRSLRKLTMRQFAELGRIQPRLLGGKWICDECFADAGLAEQQPTPTVTRPEVLTPAPPSRHRSVA
jgi:hypothetical protein